MAANSDIGATMILAAGPRRSEAAERLFVTQAIPMPGFEGLVDLVPNVSPEVLRSGGHVNA
jgi:hypothetical protein